MNEMTPKISVIVPVYKAEAYLHRCVDSLLAQTFTDFEILLVDDGSPDRSGEICDEYARKDSRVRVFHKENGGVSSARQCGMDNARGEYTIHADPDDWVDPTMLEELYRKAKEEDADMVICDYFVEERKKTKRIIQKPSALDHNVVLEELFQQLHGSCWNKLVRRACYVKYGVRFPLELSYCEDLFVNTCLLTHKINVACLPKAFYHYDQYTNEESLVHRPIDMIMAYRQQFISILSTSIPNCLYNRILPYWQCKDALLILQEGKPYVSTYAYVFKAIKSYVKKLDISIRSKVLLYTAVYLSPCLAHLMLSIWIKVRE